MFLFTKYTWIHLLIEWIIFFKNAQDGRINYDEFVAMMKKGNPDMVANTKKRRSGVFVS